ncbi:hypothetical protein EVA_11303 [gut metagenome]|uniref:Uncharacterized protein n=1 Tax=gut metagenome TaxID=749906 RepID=J9GLH3_9ZZZZ
MRRGITVESVVSVLTHLFQFQFLIHLVSVSVLIHLVFSFSFNSPCFQF